MYKYITNWWWISFAAPTCTMLETPNHSRHFCCCEKHLASNMSNIIPFCYEKFHTLKPNMAYNLVYWGNGKYLIDAQKTLKYIWFGSSPLFLWFTFRSVQCTKPSNSPIKYFIHVNKFAHTIAIHTHGRTSIHGIMWHPEIPKINWLNCKYCVPHVGHDYRNLLMVIPTAAYFANTGHTRWQPGDQARWGTSGEAKSLTRRDRQAYI